MFAFAKPFGISDACQAEVQPRSFPPSSATAVSTCRPIHASPPSNWLKPSGAFLLIGGLASSSILRLAYWSEGGGTWPKGEENIYITTGAEEKRRSGGFFSIWTAVATPPPRVLIGRGGFEAVISGHFLGLACRSEARWWWRRQGWGGLEREPPWVKPEIWGASHPAQVSSPALRLAPLGRKEGRPWSRGGWTRSFHHPFQLSTPFLL